MHTPQQAAIIANKMVMGRLWLKMQELDLSPLLTEESWFSQTEQEDKEINLARLLSLGGRILSHPDRINDLAEIFILQTLLNQAEPKVRIDLIKILDEAKIFYLEHKDPEKQRALYEELDKRSEPSDRPL